ncbi:uncharacterized protein C2845_PM11G15540 [Panicum miliaceum]|uniref:Uncharacterized protein n=1 Tax=Panicum miliaceum TaxID=4540 RepID=A0A3L6RRN0_PANMI|nr:uncharacterized protein C2845_PM11G15540 [Panicum miliaceum]
MGRGDTSSAAAAAVVWKMVTLEEIRALPPSATRPFYPRTLRRGIRSLKEPKPWKCSECGNVNDLTCHLVFDLPAFKCRACNAEPREGDADFGFCYSDIAMNEACPIGHKRWLEEGNEKMDTYSGLSLLTMIHVFQLDGVKETKTSGLHKKTNNESQKLHNVSDWGWVDQNDFAAMSSAVADGYPLICLYSTGPKLASLKPGDIYVPPLHGATGGHASLLVGAHQEGRVKLLYFLSSNGERSCQRSDKKGDGIRGGIGAIISGRFDFNPVQIFRFNERIISLKTNSYFKEYSQGKADGAKTMRQALEDPDGGRGLGSRRSTAARCRFWLRDSSLPPLSKSIYVWKEWTDTGHRATLAIARRSSCVRPWGHQPPVYAHSRAPAALRLLRARRPPSSTFLRPPVIGEGVEVPTRLSMARARRGATAFPRGGGKQMRERSRGVDEEVRGDEAALTELSAKWEVDGRRRRRQRRAERDC